MKNKKIYILLAAILVLFSLENLFLSFSFVLEQPEEPVISESPETDVSAELPRIEKQYKVFIEMSQGAIFKISSLNEILHSLNEPLIPADGKLERSTNKIERIILSKKLGIYFDLFLLFLSLSTIIALINDAWFSTFIARTLYAVGAAMTFIYMAKALIISSYYSPALGFPVFLVHLTLLFLYIIAIFKVDSIFEGKEKRYTTLLMASQSEEDNVRPSMKELKSETAKKEGFFKNRIILHFIYIIFSGILVGNLVYIPLFSLQKHYLAQFGYLLLVMIILLSVTYIRNYYLIGQEANLSKLRNSLVSISFLQFRFIKNLFFFLLSTAGVILFITCLFLLLNFNTTLLKNHDIIDKTINL